MNGKVKIAAGVLLLAGIASYVFTAPYPGNQGLQRTPGVIIGGTETPAPDDFSTVNDVGGNLLMKFSGFPPFVIYLSYVGTPEGVITATRPDGGYWAQRVRDGGKDGWLRMVTRGMRCRPRRSWVTHGCRCSNYTRAKPACRWT